jgi:hypothetical protein
MRPDCEFGWTWFQALHCRPLPAFPLAASMSGVAVEICTRLGAVVEEIGMVQSLTSVLVPVLVVMLV